MTLQRVLREAPPQNAEKDFKALQKRNQRNSEARGKGDAGEFVLQVNHLDTMQAQFVSTAGACLLGVEAIGPLLLVTSFTVIFGLPWKSGRRIEETVGVDEALVRVPQSDGRSLDKAKQYIMRHGKASLGKMYHGLRRRGEINDGDLIELQVRTSAEITTNVASATSHTTSESIFLRRSGSTSGRATTRRARSPTSRSR